MARRWGDDLRTQLNKAYAPLSDNHPYYTDKDNDALIDEIARLQTADNDGDYEPLVTTIATLNRENEQLLNNSAAELIKLRSENTKMAQELRSLRGKYDKAGQALISSIASLITSQRSMRKALQDQAGTPP